MIKKVIAFLLLCTALFSSSTLFCAAQKENKERKTPEGGYHWYIKRTKDHTAPLLDEGMRFIEDYGALYCDKKAAENGEKKIYLTFDVGYENGNVEKIVNTLREQEVKGSFFVLSHFLKKNTELACRMTEDGHILCNHTSSHGDMSAASRQEFEKELKDLEKLTQQKTGKPLHPFYRPPRGQFSEENLAWARDMGYTTVFWSMCYADWDNSKQPKPSQAASLLCDSVHPGAIVLLHPTSKTNAEIIGSLISDWKAQGYTFCTLDEIGQ